MKGKKDNINEKIDSIFIDGKIESISDEDFDFEERVINSDVIQLITRLMKSDGRNWNQEKLAEALGISASHVSKLFSGDKKVNLNIIAKLERIFDARIRIVTSDMVIKQIVVDKSKIKYLEHPNFKRLVYGDNPPPIQEKEIVNAQLDYLTPFTTKYNDAR